MGHVSDQIRFKNEKPLPGNILSRITIPISIQVLTVENSFLKSRSFVKNPFEFPTHQCHFVILSIEKGSIVPNEINIIYEFFNVTIFFTFQFCLPRYLKFTVVPKITATVLKSMGFFITSKYRGMPSLTGSTGERKGPAEG
eukprot:TRINITY_DN1828_c0_g1_i13.p1 TRINITY_DN1828_c0_g1~~TRINITY_DN1828_c0_g1_i13.p1  ORF type:complete len:141 (+),score=9.49 TRINITY_DN1828_c0_g1_i13:367-789(+)